MADDLQDAIDAAAAAATIGKLDLATELIDRYRMGLLGSLWCDAEGLSWDDLDDEAQEAITDRIRKQEGRCAGDLTVRAARVSYELQRLAETPSYLLTKFLEETDQQKVQRFHVYDSIDFGEPEHRYTVNLFGNANIGYLERTNLRIAGRISSDGPIFIARLYSTAIPPIETLGGIVILEIGRQRIHAALVHQLLLRPQFIDAFVPSRSNIRLQFEALHKSPVKAPSSGRIYFHLEGYRVTTY